MATVPHALSAGTPSHSYTITSQSSTSPSSASPPKESPPAVLNRNRANVELST